MHERTILLVTYNIGNFLEELSFLQIQYTKMNEWINSRWTKTSIYNTIFTVWLRDARCDDTENLFSKAFNRLSFSLILHQTGFQNNQGNLRWADFWVLKSCSLLPRNIRSLWLLWIPFCPISFWEHLSWVISKKLG